MVALMASFFTISTAPHPRLRFLSAPHSPSSTTQFKRMVILPLKCSTEPTQNAPDPETETSSSSSPSPSAPVQSVISAYSLCAGIGALGFVETSYLTYLKLTGGEAFCPIGGGTCTDVLDSDYAMVFGVPLSLIGMLAYGLVASLGLLLAVKKLPSGLGESNGRLILLGATTSMAAASAYFVYLLNVKFAGASCSYCYVSAALSFTLLFITLKDFGFQEIQNVVGQQLLIAGLVVAALNTSYSPYLPVSASLADINLPYYETEIVKHSSPYALSLAKHLSSIGARMYGAFWCSHCSEQKQMFGQEAAKILDYVECFPNGFTKETKMALECSLARIEGFPTWVINGQVLSGEQEFSELAKVSGFVPEDVSSK